MYVTLVVVDGKVDKRQLEIRLPARLGRSRQADVTIAHSFISRMHCELREHEDGILLTDLGSLNGTYLGNRRVRSVLLQSGDRFSIGPLTFELRCELPVEPAPGQPAGAESGTGRAIELPDPIDPDPVELDEEARPIGPRRHAAHALSGRGSGDRRKQKLPGFVFRAEDWEEDDEGESSGGRGGETISFDPAHYDVGGGLVRFDAPTRHGENAGSGTQGSRDVGEKADGDGQRRD